MATIHDVPGVHRETVLLEPAGRLATGIPGFVGFADVRDGRPHIDEPKGLNRREEFAATFTTWPGSVLDEVVAGFFENGGQRCYIVRAEPDPQTNRASALARAVDALAAVVDVDLVAVPDVMSLRTSSNALDVGAIARVQRHVLTHCAEQGDRFALLDALPAATPEAVLEQRDGLMIGQEEPVNGALYYPWIQRTASEASLVALSSQVARRFVPPCGHIAGIIARTDARVGVFKAPANEEIVRVFDLETAIDDTLQTRLNPAHVNCLRAFPGRGIRVWGARTLSRDPNWRHVNVRRLVLTVHRWIAQNMPWAAFEPNDIRLWVRIQRELTTYLTTLLQAGGLKGARPGEAFYVKCDAETNPPEQREAGEVRTEIGLAPLAPAEFVVVRIVHHHGAQARNG